MNQKTLWIITHYLHCTPRIEHWPLLEETSHYYTVQYRSSKKKFGKTTSGKYYFTDRNKAVEWLRRHYNRELRDADRAVRHISVLQTLTDDELIAYVEGRDEICIRVAKETN